MRPRNIMPIVAAAGIAFASAVVAAEKPGKPLNIKPTASSQTSDNWRERAMKARAEFAPDGAPQSGRSRAVNERGDRPGANGEEVGAGALGKDQGEGGGKEE